MPLLRTDFRRTVQLLHELPDGTSHVDWMIARDRAGREPLISFRLPRRIDELKPGQCMAAERIADHRPAYLDYEGRVSGERGSVRRLAWGTVVSERRQRSSWNLEIRWHDRGDGMAMIRQRLRLEPLEAGATAWEAVCEAAEATDG
ncbi:MAG: hypothetical protein V3T84_16475 [Phycisphaerales bacterium]